MDTSTMNTTTGRKAIAVLNNWYGGSYFIPAAYEGSLFRSFHLQPAVDMEAVSWLKVNPNPASDDVTIELDMRDLPLSKCKLLITDIAGRTVTEHDIMYAQQQFAIDIRKWTAGCYMAVVRFDGKNLSSANFNVVH